MNLQVGSPQNEGYFGVIKPKQGYFRWEPQGGIIEGVVKRALNLGPFLELPITAGEALRVVLATRATYTSNPI